MATDLSLFGVFLAMLQKFDDRSSSECTFDNGECALRASVFSVGVGRTSVQVCSAR